jgi:hypothetical protein
MKRFKNLYIGLCMLALAGCKTVDYEYETFQYAATPRVTINTESSALPTYQTANVTFFNMNDPEFATTQKFEWELSYYDADGRAPVKEIEVYVSFNKRESNVPVYPIILSLAQVQPNDRQFPLPSRITPSDMLYETVTTFPKSYSFTAQELADITGTNLGTVAVNDYFLFKFVVIMQDGTRIVQYNDNSCDESRGELCDCRVGVRFKDQ